MHHHRLVQDIMDAIPYIGISSMSFVTAIPLALITVACARVYYQPQVTLWPAAITLFMHVIGNWSGCLIGHSWHWHY
jgi:hypothetical protein